ncbi:MAG TPA: GNAT family N-acetyltransferase [Bacteroidia bacterium]|nr:GNAT family N-acetyltransferase [Bacteroidia bacterium]
MEVKQSSADKKGMFYIEDHEKKQAMMTYTFIDASGFSIDHTVVQPGNEGKGLGKMLVKAAVDFARANHLKILPICPYAKSVFDKTAEYKDILIN